MKQVVVIGGGPAGYVGAIRAAQLGAEVQLVESEAIGGTCLNIGCIPTKALLHTAHLFAELSSGSSGVVAENTRLDWPMVLRHKQGVVHRLVQGVEGLLKANGVKIHKGTAVLTSDGTIEVGGAAPLKLAADAVILAVGSEPVKLNFPGSCLPGVIDSTAALSLPRLPRSLTIIGGGVIGVEFAALFRSFGSEVAVVEMLPQILPPVDGEIASQVRKELGRRGVQFLTGARLTEVVEKDGALCARVEIAGESREIASELVLVAVGRKPRTGGLGLEAAGIAAERGRICVDANFQTNIDGIYAVGDCNGQIMLAHAASAQAVAAVEHALGHKSAYFSDIIPACIYTDPEVASVGMTEEQTRARGLKFKVGTFPLAGNGKAVIESGGTGMMKIICGDKYGEILGVHIFGPRATDLIAEAALAIRLEATVDELISTIHAHPTVSEAMAEAALAVSGRAIHWPPRKR